MPRDLYPFDDDDLTERVTMTVRLKPRTYERLKALVYVMNGIDAALGRKGRKWKMSSVIERVLSVGADGHLEELGGVPGSDEALDDIIEKAVERYRQRLGKHKKKQ